MGNSIPCLKKFTDKSEAQSYCKEGPEQVAFYQSAMCWSRESWFLCGNLCSQGLGLSKFPVGTMKQRKQCDGT